MKKKHVKTIAFIFLAIHLFAIHTRLIFHLNPDNESATKIFSFLAISENVITSEIFAIAYSIMTAIALYYNARLWIILTFATIDALSVFLYYKYDFGDYGILFGALYYSVYTFAIIFALSKINFTDAISEFQVKVDEMEILQPLASNIDKKITKDVLKDRIFELKKAGFTGREIAKRLNISESKVSRTLKL